MMLMSLPASHAWAQQDTLVLIPDKLILRLKPAYVSHFSKIIKRHQSLSTTEQYIADALAEKGISGCRFLQIVKKFIVR